MGLQREGGQASSGRSQWASRGRGRLTLTKRQGTALRTAVWQPPQPPTVSISMVERHADTLIVNMP